MSVKRMVAKMRSMPDTGEKLLRFVENGIGIRRPGQMIHAGQLHVFGARNLRGHVAAGPHVDGLVAHAVLDQGRHPNGGQDMHNGSCAGRGRPHG